ncbi:hypothetical protein L1887_36506 [Cichorium endivia]|nr:hypothetical protein L1887_36506 [Cichorium endivia]
MFFPFPPPPSLLHLLPYRDSAFDLSGPDRRRRIHRQPSPPLICRTSISLEVNFIQPSSRATPIFQILKFPHHNLTVEAASPGLFVDKNGGFWDVPLTMAIDLAFVASEMGPSYHVCINHNSGSPKSFGSHKNDAIAASLQLGLCVTTAFSLKNSIDIWRSESPKLKNVQPYDVFLSNPHILASYFLLCKFLRLEWFKWNYRFSISIMLL